MLVSPFVDQFPGGFLVATVLMTLVFLSALLAIGGRLRTMVGVALVAPALLLANQRAQEKAGIENKPRRKRRNREQIAELLREFKDSGLTQRKFSENRGIALSELQRSLKIVRRASEPQLMAVQIEAAERNERALELMVGEGYRINKRFFAPRTSGTLQRVFVRSLIWSEFQRVFWD